MPTQSRHIVRSEKELAALTAAARQEVVDVLAGLGTVSVAELAAALGRPADALYFHLRALTSAGLVRHAGYRYRKGRKEALYRTVATQLLLRYDTASPRNRKLVTGIVASMLRLGIRDFSRAFQAGGVEVSGAHRELWALRKTARLTRAQVAELNRGIDRVAQRVSGARGQGRLYAVTVLLTPLNRRRKS